jgi:DNA-binding transcriptional LysR family regulator
VDLLSIRRELYGHYAATGQPPTLAADELAALEAVHAIVLDPTGAIAFANPFATAPSPFRVETDRRSYNAVCAWDALGVLAAFGSDGTVESDCPDCGEPLALRVRHGAIDPTNATVHFLVPAARWYDDLAFT